MALQAGGSAKDLGSDIVVDASGTSFLTGYFQGSAAFGGTTLTSAGSEDVFVAAVSRDGSWQWALGLEGYG